MELQQKVQGIHKEGKIFHLHQDLFHFVSLVCLLLLWAGIEFLLDHDDHEEEEEKADEEENEEG